MIELKTKEGITDVHAEGSRTDLAADAVCIFHASVSVFAQHTGMNRARALILLTQAHLEYLSKEGDTE